jgi:AAA15 family ATPase/GTPase
MLKKLILENYRCFEKTDISFKELSIIVGKNNAGKSTLIEALRILSLVVNKCKTMVYTSSPSWLMISEQSLGISPSLISLDLSKGNIIYMYGDGPAKMIAEFENGVIINTFINEDNDVFAIIKDSNGVNVESKKFASNLRLKDINILPQISPLQRNENVIKYETVQKNLPSYLSSRNFRNQLYYYPKSFDKFKELAERTWKGLQIHGAIDTRTQGSLFLFVRDSRFEAEIGLMGHGLQMWLQTMWFLSRSSSDSTVILDEPDVYMHADLQRRLIKLIKTSYKQVMVATHSVEIMSEVEAENILPINNTKKKQEYANKAPIVQKIVNEIGSVHNIEIARLFSHNKFLVVEGEKDDVKLLSIFHSKIFPNSFDSLDILPKTFVKGWGGWQRVIGSHNVFRDNRSEISTYCIFDSDYQSQDDITTRLLDAQNKDINLHIWRKKEIENYLIHPLAILRIIKSKKKNSQLTEEDVKNIIDRFCDEVKDDVIDSYATSIKEKDNSKAIKTANQEARKYVNTLWDAEKIKIVPGKHIIAKICNWMTEEQKVSTNKFAIARELKIEELDSELISVVTSIENRVPFTTQ